MNRLSLFLPTLLCACTASLHDGTFPTGSATLISAGDGETLYVVDGDSNAVVRFEPASGALSTVEVGEDPRRLARAGTRVFVTLSGARSVAVLEERGGTLERVDTVEVGAEPYGIVAREDGTKLYVALSAADEVVELDATTLAVTRRWDVSGHPSWIALHPSGEALYAASAVGGALSWIDLGEGGAVTVLDLPAIYGAGEDGAQRFTRRMTGDIAVAPNGRTLAVPALYLDNNNPVSDPGETEIQSDGYGSVGIGVSRFNPSMIEIPLDDGGNPSANDAATVLVAGFAQLGSDEFDTTPVRSYLSSATFSPDGLYIYATMEASESVVVLSSTPLYPDLSADTGRFFDTGGSSVSADQAGFASSPLVLIGTDAGPRGVAFLGEDTAYVHAFLDRTVGSVKAGAAGEAMGSQLASGFVSSDTFRGADGATFGPSPLASDLEAGRRLFYAATSSQMAASGAGISCSTCHLDGRNDGLTWTFEDGVRQTPSLAGAVGATAPFTWTSVVGTVSDEAQITSSGRMGGNGLSYAEAGQVAAYIESIRAVDVPLKGSTEADVLRGKEIFERADVACATCHSGERYTDNAFYSMYGLEAVNTPTLVGVAATAPYLHSGAAATLEDVLVMSRSGEMGNTSTLSDTEIADLAAYLRSL